MTDFLLKKLPLLACLLFSGLLTAGELKSNELSPAERIYGLSSIWMEARRDFPFPERLEHWDEKYFALIDRVANASDKRAYYRLLEEFIATLHDGHSFILLPDRMYVTQYRPPVGLQRVEGKAIVAWTADYLLPRIPLGSVVIEVDNRPVEEAARAAAVAVSASTEHVLMDRAYAIALNGEKDSSLKLTLKTPEGETHTVQLERGKPWPEGSKPVFLKPDTTEQVSFRSFDGGKSAYMALHAFYDEDTYKAFAAHLPEMRRADNVILDLRDNDGGDDAVAFRILSHFLSQAVLSSSSSRLAYVPTDASRPDDKAGFLDFRKNTTKIQTVAIAPDKIVPAPEAERIRGRLVILTNHDTLSAAEDFIAAAQALKALRIGTTTAGSTGQPNFIPLPGGGRAAILSKHDRLASGEEFVGIGFKPDIRVEETIADARAHIDTVLEYALSYLRTEQK